MPKPSQACFDAAAKAAGGKLSPKEIEQAFDRVEEMKKKLAADGKLDGINERLRQLTEQEAQRTVIAAALRRKHVALNTIVRDRLEAHIGGLVQSGLSYHDAVLATMEGSNQGVAGARVSVFAQRQAYERRYIGEMFAEIAKERPHVQSMLGDQRFNEDIVREMYELREGGTPGRTKNEDAKFVASVFAKGAEVSRTDLNRLGANIGRLDGWAGPQVHDDAKLLKITAKEWADYIAPRLDTNRTFPDAVSDAEVRHILEDVYTTITTGQGTGLGAARKGERVGPANLAKSLGKSRVLHFRDADAWIEYNGKFGHGSIFSSIISHQQRAASTAAQMELYGPNPEIMLGSLIDQLRERIRNDHKVPAKDKAKQIDTLNFGTTGLGNSIGNAFAEMQGLTMSPTNHGWATLSANIRGVQTLAKLGSAVLTAAPTDTVTAAAASMFRGGGFWRGFGRQVAGVLHGRPKGEQREISYLIGEGYDGFIGAVASPYMAHDGTAGWMHRRTIGFFKWNGLTWWTDVARSVAGRVASAEMGMRAAAAWDKLPDRYRHVLELNGLTAAKWDAIRSVEFRASNGNSYVTPDLMRNVEDAALAPLIEGRLAKLEVKDPIKRETARQRYLADTRRELEMDVARFFADETSNAVVETDAASRRILLQGTRPGTFVGEVWRFMAQFKGFPIAFANRVLGRAFYGGRGATKGQRFVNNLPHSGALLSGLMMAGYAAMTMKDVSKGRWPPRDPSDPKVILASLTQGGTLGIYGDFLFGEVNRFGNTPLETGVGPTIGMASNVIGEYQRAIRGESSAAAWLNVALNNTPYANLFYSRAVMEWLFLNSLRESISPGYLRRQERRLNVDQGQRKFLPETL